MLIRTLFGGILLALCCSSQTLCAAEKAPIPAGEYVPFFDPEKEAVAVSAFQIDVFPVTQSEYLDFVRQNPHWSRSQVKRIFADSDYLKNWKNDFEVQNKKAPVTYVSWFAAKAYCESKNERLPLTDEWEYVAQASELSADGNRGDENKAKILEWYGKPTAIFSQEVGSTFKNFFGVYDMHGLVWEWVFDFKSVPKSDGRGSSINLPENLFCAGGVGLAADPANYATFMRFAFRSSLKGSYTIKDLGFRCAKGNL